MIYILKSQNSRPRGEQVLLQKNSAALVHKRTIPTGRPPLAYETTINDCQYTLHIGKPHSMHRRSKKIHQLSIG
jgi:hypothetical protein